LSGEHAAEWFNTYSVTSGRPDRAHFYYRMTEAAREFGNKKWAEPGINGNVFEMKVHGGQVVAEGSVHPDTGQEYRVTQDLPLIPFPAGLMALMREHYGKDNAGPRERVPREKIREGDRHDALVREAGRILRVTEMSKHVLTAHLQDFNEEWMETPLDSEEVERVAMSCNWKPEPEVGEVVIGEPAAPAAPVKDWRTHYHTFEEVRDVKPPKFLIDGFLQVQAICGIAAPVGQRKSLIALNAAHALCTGEPLFGRFEVPKTVDKVLYLCPEMGLISFAERVKRIGLESYVGKSFFCRTMSSEGFLRLGEMTDEEVSGAVVTIDTAVRFMEGDENSADHMSLFAKQIFGLIQRGALAVMVLHHSQKSTAKVEELTLENCLRGSGELGAFLTSCWGTRLENSSDEDYYGPSLLKNVKQRDFKSRSFKVTSSEDCRLHFVPDSEGTKLSHKTAANQDGRDAEAVDVIRDNPELSQVKIVAKLKTMGITRSRSWVGNKRFDLGLGGVKTSVD
jgi:hypothetical protein